MVVCSFWWVKCSDSEDGVFKWEILKTAEALLLESSLTTPSGRGGNYFSFLLGCSIFSPQPTVLSRLVRAYKVNWWWLLQDKDQLQYDWLFWTLICYFWFRLFQRCHTTSNGLTYCVSWHAGGLAAYNCKVMISMSWPSERWTPSVYTLLCRNRWEGQFQISVQKQTVSCGFLGVSNDWKFI